MKGFSSATLWIVIFLVFLLLFMHFRGTKSPTAMGLSEWTQKAKDGLIVTAEDQGMLLTGKYKLNANDTATADYETKYTGDLSTEFFKMAQEYKFEYSGNPKSDFLSTVVFSLIVPLAIVLVFWLILMRQLQGGGQQGDELRQKQGAAGQRGGDQSHIQGCGRRR